MSTSIFSDIDINFSLDSSGDLKMVTDNDSVSQSITNILNTVKGFRPGEDNDTFGVGIKVFLFSPMSNFVAERLGEELYRQLKQHEPRIEITNVEVTMSNENKQYDISIYYKTINSQSDLSQSYRLILKTL